MKTCLVLLVGDQPVPNLLPARHLQPDKFALIHTDRTKNIAEKLKNALPGQESFLCCVEPYRIQEIHETLQKCLLHLEDLAQYELTFNLTGGTKPMSLAAFQMAFQERKRSRLVYFQTEGGRSALHHYRFTDTGMLRLEKSEEITKTITLDDYLRLHVGSYAQGDLRDEFEQKVHEALRRIDGLEILTSVRPEELDAQEIDFVIRLGNQVGVIETKTKAAKKGIDQIQAVAEQRYLGTYVSKFLVSGQPLDKNNKLDIGKIGFGERVADLRAGATSTALSESHRQAR